MNIPIGFSPFSLLLPLAVLSRDPAFSIEAYLATLHYKQTDDLDHHREALSRAGLPA